MTAYEKYQNVANHIMAYAKDQTNKHWQAFVATYDKPDLPTSLALASVSTKTQGLEWARQLVKSIRASEQAAARGAKRKAG